MCTFLSLQIVLVMAAAVQAFTWPGRQSGLVKKQHPDILDNDIWHTGELSALLDNHDKLEAYKRKPDCFRRVAGTIRAQCGDLDMDEDERVRAAISMTICELATAKHTPPLECTSAMYFEDIPSVDVGSPGKCVEALSRSAQYWSSYSGYLREIPQLCHAFRRWNDIDMAKEIYRNASLEAISILRVVNDVEKRQQDYYDGIDGISEHLKHITQEMSKANVELSENASDAFRRLQVESKQAAISLQHTLNSVLEVYSGEHDTLIHGLSKQMQSIVQDHSQTLNMLAPSIQAALESQIGYVLDEIWGRVRDLNLDALAARDNWLAVSDEFDRIQQAVTMLAHTITDTILVLDAHVDQAVLANRIQAETTDAAGRLGETIANMATFTRSEMEKFNDTASAIHNQWLTGGGTHAVLIDWRHWGDWTLYTTQWLLQALLRVDPTVVDHIFGSRILSFAGLFCRVAWYIVCSCLTSVTSILLLVASFRKVLSKEAAPPNEAEACHSQPYEEPVPRPKARLVSRSLASVSNARSLSGRSQGSFSRIPDRLCRSPTN